MTRKEWRRVEVDEERGGQGSGGAKERQRGMRQVGRGGARELSKGNVGDWRGGAGEARAASERR